MSTKRTPLVVALLLILAAGMCFSQSTQLNIPRDSQHAAVTQRVGITDITVNYHRPLVKGRTIWGKVVPYGQVWRAGANENTIITFTDAVSIDGKPLDKGTYGLHMIPNENEWTVIFSKVNTAWGSFSYKEGEDALRVNVKPQSTEMQEALAYTIEPTEDSAIVTMRWEKISVMGWVGRRCELPARAQGRSRRSARLLEPFDRLRAALRELQYQVADS